MADRLRSCYQCGKETTYLFADSRCGECTRLTPEEVRGDIIDEEGDDDVESQEAAS